MADAAAQSGLVAMAEQHVEDVLEAAITRLGVEEVEVRFESPPASSPQGESGRGILGRCVSVSETERTENLTGRGP